MYVEFSEGCSNGVFRFPSLSGKPMGFDVLYKSSYCETQPFIEYMPFSKKKSLEIVGGMMY